jgi:hypothetical protein
MFLPICGLNTVPVILVNVEPAFFNPSGIQTKQKVPKGVMKLVFSSSSFAIQHWWYLEKQSSRDMIAELAAESTT